MATFLENLEQDRFKYVTNIVVETFFGTFFGTFLFSQHENSKNDNSVLGFLTSYINSMKFGLISNLVKTLTPEHYVIATFGTNAAIDIAFGCCIKQPCLGVGLLLADALSTYYMMPKVDNDNPEIITNDDLNENLDTF